jgi:hypothetical protein
VWWLCVTKNLVLTQCPISILSPHHHHHHPSRTHCGRYPFEVTVRADAPSGKVYQGGTFLRVASHVTNDTPKMRLHGWMFLARRAAFPALLLAAGRQLQHCEGVHHSGGETRCWPRTPKCSHGRTGFSWYISQRLFLSLFARVLSCNGVALTLC